MLEAIIEYNKPIDSVTREIPIGTIHCAPSEFKLKIRDRISHTQVKQSKHFNKNRQMGEKVFVWYNRRLGNYISILDGKAIVWEEYEFLKRTSNPSVYYEIASETKNLIDTFPPSNVRKILDSDTRHITTLLPTTNIHRRHASTIKILDTALKIIADTLDADDFEKRLNQKQLTESDNRQIHMNTKIQIQIEKLTNAINTIFMNPKKEQLDNMKLFEMLFTRNRIILTELQNLMLSVTMAKVSIVNPIILDQDDLKSLISDKEYTNTSISNLMNVSS